jgi:hypothetical protein
MSGNSTIGTFEECADELRDFVSTLQRYAPEVLALALRAHLCGLLYALQAQGGWSGEQAAGFLEDMVGEMRER